MKTKNIQDVVAERVEEFDDKFRWLDDLEVSATGMSYANKSAYGTLDEVKDWLTTTLTQLVKEVEAGEQQRVMDMVRYYSKDAWSQVWDCINAGVEPYNWDNMTDEEKRKTLTTPPISDEEK